MIHPISCPGCGLCIKECILQNDAIHYTETGVAIDLDKCVRCGHCTAICPNDCMTNPLSPPQELIESILPADQAVKFLRTPRSIRYYQNRLVPKEVLQKLLDIGRYPQTGENSQGISYLVISGREKLDKLNQLYCKLAAEIPEDFPGYDKIQNTVQLQKKYGHDALFYNGSQLILALSSPQLETWRENAQFSLPFISLLAPSLGLGTCWIGLLEFLACHEPYMQYFSDLIQLPPDKRICACMLVGYPAVKFRRLVARDPLLVEWR